MSEHVNLYNDDIIHVGAECGCFARYFAMGKNEHSGDHMTSGWSNCKDHDVQVDFETGVKLGILKVKEIYIIRGQGV